MYARSCSACIWCTRTPSRRSLHRSSTSSSPTGSPFASGRITSVPGATCARRSSGDRGRTVCAIGASMAHRAAVCVREYRSRPEAGAAHPLGRRRGSARRARARRGVARRDLARRVSGEPSVLTVNAGSSSLKLRLLGPGDELRDERELAARGGHADAAELAAALDAMGTPDAVGHRIVHGGARLPAPARMEDDVGEPIRALPPPAPLHQPAALAAYAAVTADLPGVPAVACVDTAFHAGMPPAAAVYALP